MKLENKSFHLWGIKKPFKDAEGRYNNYNGWEYIKACTNDRRALIGLDTRKYSQLEIRYDDGTLATSFFKETVENRGT